jgi:hypothetical protein
LSLKNRRRGFYPPSILYAFTIFMKQLKFTLSFFSILLILISCDSGKIGYDENYEIKSFTRRDISNSKLLLGQKLQFEEIVFPRFLTVFDNYIIVTERDANHFIHLIELRGNKQTYIRSLGVKGDGPGEIRGVSFIDAGFGDGTFWTYMLNNMLFSNFVLNDTSIYAINQLRLDIKNYLSVGVAWTADSTIMVVKGNDHEKFVEMDLDGTTINTFGSWTGMIEGDYPDNIIPALYSGRFLSSPDKQTFGLFCSRTDVIEILNRNKKKIISIRGPENHMPDFEVDYSSGYPMYYTPNHLESRPQYFDGHFTDKYIYALYSGRTRAEIDQKNIMCDEVFVFDYGGNLLKHYKLDHSLLTFAIDEKHNKMYGGTYDANPGIVVFDLD